MSLNEHQGSVYAIREFMRAIKADIDRGDRKGATVLYSVKGGKSFWERVAIRKQWDRIVRFRKRA